MPRRLNRVPNHPVMSTNTSTQGSVRAFTTISANQRHGSACTMEARGHPKVSNVACRHSTISMAVMRSSSMFDCRALRVPWFVGAVCFM